MNKYLVCIYSLLLLGCTNFNPSNNCPIENDKLADLFFYIDSSFVKEKECFYIVKSNYFDKNIFNGKLLKKENSVLINFSKSNDEYELFFSFDATIGTKNYIHIYQRNWKNKSPDEKVMEAYQISLEQVVNNTNEKVAILKLHQIANGFENLPTLDVIVFFSSRKGFIGSYYLNPNFPFAIIGKAGNILEDIIDYSKFTDYTLE